jgi:tRNA threonylcarbamoyladenosine biosynthesis protein TsaE
MISDNIVLTTCSFKETFILGQKTGAMVFSGSVIALTGELGSGKTSFVKGLASGLEVPSAYHITSPTYTIVNTYPGRYRLYHLDLYRLVCPVDDEEIGLDEIIFGRHVVAIEWANRLAPDYMAEYLSIHFEILNDESRKIDIRAYGPAYECFIKQFKRQYCRKD